MLLTTPSDLDPLWQWIIQDMRSALTESRTRSRQICAEATAICATAAELRTETAQLRHSARLLRTVRAEYLAAGVADVKSRAR